MLALAVWAVFGQTIHFEFVGYDDPVYVYENPVITQGFSLHGAVLIFTHLHVSGDWLPLTAISHMVDWQFYGSNAGSHHLTNVLLHAATAILLFLVLQKMTGARWRSAFVAVVFAIHPLRVESVAWVSERKDVLSGVFFMLTLWGYVQYAQKRPRVEGREAEAERVSTTLDSRRWVFDYYLALTFFALGLLSKSMLVTLPFVLLLLDYWPLNRWSSSGFAPPRFLSHVRLGLIVEKIPFLLLSGVSCVATVLSQKEAIVAVQGISFPWRAGNAFVAYATYLWQMFYPTELAVLYPHPENQLPIWQIGLAVMALLIISAAVMTWRRKYPCLLVGWLWYLGMLVPVVGFLRVGAQARADRYTYLPQIGLYLLVAWGMVELCGSWRHRRAVLGCAAGVIIASLLAVARVQTSYWKDTVTLWTHALACTSENYIAEDNLGLELADQGKIDEAIQHYETALKIKPDFAEAHSNVGNALASRGNMPEALKHYERALELKPSYTEAHINMGNVLFMQGELTKAIEHYGWALQLNPDSAEAHYDLGYALASQGNLTEAITHYERALQLKPEYAEAQYNLGYALASQGNLTEAITHYERALQLKPNIPEFQNNLGIALSKQGKLDEASLHFQQALILATAQGNVALAETIRAQINSNQPPSAQQHIP